jgi:mono/diheme cytochrome c family protein
MKTLLMRLGITGLSLGLLFFTCVYGLSSWMMQEKYIPQERSFVVSPGANIEEGRRLAAIRGCTDCHGKDASGGDFYGLHAPNLRVVAKQYSDNDLERSIRQAISPDGTSVYSMTSDAYQHMSDIDLGHIIVYLRSLNPVSKTSTVFSPNFRYRLGIIKGGHQPVVNAIHSQVPPVVAPKNNAENFGRYLAYSVCSECHAPDLKGYKGFSPSLVTTLAYQRLDFSLLMSTGTGLGGRNLGLMSISSKERFSLFSDAEFTALFTYFQSEQFLQDIQ